MSCCEYETRLDPDAYVEQYLVRCTHHDGDTLRVWRPGDAPYRCAHDVEEGDDGGAE